MTYQPVPATLDDVPALARMAADAFRTDRQTQMKALGQARPFDMEKYALQALPRDLARPRCVILKVVDPDTPGENNIMGYCNWGFHGFLLDDIPNNDVDEKSLPPPPPVKATVDPPPPPPTVDITDPIQRLEQLTGADLQAWVDENNCEGGQCMFVIGLAVAPEYQRRGVARTLLQWGTDLCDKHNVSAWVHASEPSWPVYNKAGFEVVRTLDVDLDEYAPAPPPSDEGPNAVWGHYVFRYMKFNPAGFAATKVLYNFREYYYEPKGRNGLEDWWRYMLRCTSPARYPSE
ncbi:AP-1 adaptor complex mu subunit Apm1 [Sporothrix eucalyptigena]|uniref:AP-1 adaptor complex mu subunit Apm1 n=1 Tax=Sporothrix eucalyptigena TaxID=1812306 RepID=A0ABP0B2G5_9PEZI